MKIALPKPRITNRTPKKVYKSLSINNPTTRQRATINATNPKTDFPAHLIKILKLALTI